MTSVNTFTLVIKLKARGFTEEQAHGIAETIQEIDLDQVVTRSDLRADLAELKYELLKWMFGGFLGLFVMLAGIFVRLPH